MVPQRPSPRVSVVIPTSERRDYVRRAAALWPDPRADTALYLRTHAVALALRLGRGSTAAGLLRGLPLGATPGFVARNTAVLAGLGRRRVQKLRYRGRDSGVPEQGAVTPPERHSD